MPEAPAYFAKFSHRFDAGPSGPARQYWDIKYGVAPAGSSAFTLCLHDNDDAERTAREVAFRMGQARAFGRDDFKREFREFIGCRR